MQWNGTITGDTIRGTLVWKKKGQADITYNFTNGSFPPISLDGKNYLVNTQRGDSVETEEYSFRDGKMESPSCYTWGFTAAPYTAWESDGMIHWQCNYTSPTEGRMFFSGYIMHEHIAANLIWQKEGQKNICYTGEGSLTE